jgi:hypothetical protein
MRSRNRKPTLTIYFPSAFSPEDFEFWMRLRHLELGAIWRTINLQPSDMIEWWVEEEASLSA